MFDPHRTRRSDNRYYTRKGQVIQASRVNTKPIIDQRLVPVYKQYLINNGLIIQQKYTISKVIYKEGATGQVTVNTKAFTLTTEPVVLNRAGHTCIIRRDPSDPSYWVFGFVLLTAEGQTYTIQPGCYYHTFWGDPEISDTFVYYDSSDKVVLTFNVNFSLYTTSGNSLYRETELSNTYCDIELP